MSDYNYIITVDENGSPSLAHAWGMQKGGTKKDHQWFARENVKGKWRYWYDPESYRRWAQGGVRKAQQAVNDVKKAAGNAADEVRKSIRARRELNEANNQTGLLSGLKRRQAQSAYNKTAMGRAEKAVRDAADDLSDRARGLATTAQGRARQVIDETRNNLGRNATEATKTAKKKIKNLTDAAQEHGNKTLSELRKAAGDVGDKARGAVSKVGDKLGVDEREALENANFLNRGRRQKAYDATPMGRAEKAAKNVSDRASGAADTVKDRVDAAVDSVKRAGARAADAVNTKARNVADRLGADEREDLENANFLNRRRRQEAYDATPMGKAENAVKRARDTVNNAADTVADKASDIRDRIRGLADSAGSAARNAAGRARDAADNAASRVQNAAGEVTGANAKKEMDAAGRRAMMGLDDAIGSFVDAQTRYDNSAAGRTASAKSNMEASLKSAQSAAKKALAKAMDYLPEEQIEEIKNLIRGK